MHKISKHFTFALLLTFITTAYAEAATVKQIKGSKVLIDLEGEDADIDQEFYLIDNLTGKKKALVVIKQLKNGKAVAEVKKGNPELEQGLLPKEARSKKISMDNEDKDETPKSQKGFQKKLGSSWGVVGSYLMASMNAKYSVSGSAGTTNMKGSNFGIGGFYNQVVTDNLALNITGSYDMFSVKGSASGQLCDGNTDPNCKVNISYLSFYGQLRYYISQNQFRPWVGGGGGFLLKMSSTSNVIKPPSTNQVITAAGGFDWQLNRKNYIPVSFEYHLYPPTSTVTANILTLRAGYAWNF